jgi:hypothetical protein
MYSKKAKPTATTFLEGNPAWKYLEWLFESEYAKAHTIDSFSYLLRILKKR